MERLLVHEKTHELEYAECCAQCEKASATGEEIAAHSLHRYEFICDYHKGIVWASFICPHYS
jgi:hypothetical protein